MSGVYDRNMSQMIIVQQCDFTGRCSPGIDHHQASGTNVCERPITVDEGLFLDCMAQV